jgi:hypothetical protein
MLSCTRVSKSYFLLPRSTNLPAQGTLVGVQMGEGLGTECETRGWSLVGQDGTVLLSSPSSHLKKTEISSSFGPSLKT